MRGNVIVSSVLPCVHCLQTDISSICSQPNMSYSEVSGKVFSRKSDYINSIVRSCARKLFAFQVILIVLLCIMSLFIIFFIF